VIRFLPILLLCACTPLTLPAPGAWHSADLPPGVLAEADLEAQSVAYSPALLDCPPLVVAAVVLHEVCHLRGHVAESDADCCAADLHARLYGLAATLEVVEWWQDSRRSGVLPWLVCGR
jgi:hypothetical protein